MIEHSGFSAALENLKLFLQGENRRPVLLTGESGTGKTALLRCLGKEWISNGTTVVVSTASDLTAGQTYIGELEEQVQLLVKTLAPPRKILWIASRFEEFALAGKHKYQSASILDQLLPHIESGKLLLIGEIGTAAYSQLVRQEPRLQFLFKKIELPALSDQESYGVALEWARRVVDSGPPLLTPEVLEEAQQLVKQYLPGKFGPGNLFDFIKQATQKLLAQGNLSRTLGSDDLLRTLSQLTGLPLSILDERQDLDVAGLRELFSRRVMGQDEAVRVLVDRVAMIKAGLVDPGRPAGVFFFVGPTGTGKTEIAKALAEFVYGSSERMIRYDMSEFQQPESIDRLLGSSHGQDDRALVHQIRKQPFSVILLDEFEKANAAIWDLFLQVFDDGRLSDRAGNAADFRHAIIILTSNAGATIEISRLGFKAGEAELSRAQVTQALDRTFRKEFLNRIDRIVLFQPLDRDVMRRIIRKELDAVLQRRGLRQKNWLVEWDPSAVEFLLEKGFTRDLGARPLRRAIEEHLLAPLAIRLVSADPPLGDQFLFVKRSDEGLAVEFVSPEEEEGPEAPQVHTEKDVRQLMLSPKGSVAEIEFLEKIQTGLAAELENPQWKERHEKALSQTGEPGFWNESSRFEKLGRAEYLFRIEEQVLRLGKTLSQLRHTGSEERESALADRVAVSAGRAYLLREAMTGLAESEPMDAYLLLETVSEENEAEALAFFNELKTMYREWANLRRMKTRILEESAAGPNRPGIFYFSVSGFAAYRILKHEQGLHLFEIPEGSQGFRRVRARVYCLPQTIGPSDEKAPGPDKIRSSGGDTAKIVRRYRRLPSPLVRDSGRGFRSGRLDEILSGNFDVMGGKTS